MNNKFCDSIFKYKKRISSIVKVGNITIGGDRNIVIQTMGTVSTNDIDGATEQAISMIKSGAELVRFTAQGTIEAENMGLIRKSINAKGYFTPLVADIHFNPKAAFIAAKNIEKVRINPGNFIDRKSLTNYTEELYNAELERLDENFLKLIEICKEHKTALRIGVNHGSLSERIVSKYGDTKEGMVESAMEFLRLAKKYNFNDIVVSLKSSNTQVMVRAYRLLVATMIKNDMNYPLHLGVTEAGDGDQGRIRSAVGIGALLSDGIGDTIRVSLTEKPENEVIFAKRIISHINHIAKLNENYTATENNEELYDYYEPYNDNHAKSPFIIIENNKILKSIYKDDYFTNDDGTIDNSNFIIIEEETSQKKRAALLKLKSDNIQDKKIVLKQSYNLEREDFMAAIGIDFGGILIDGFADGIWITNSKTSPEDTVKIVLDMMQASRRRTSSPEYISCPGCGRTLYDIQEVLEKVKLATVGLKNIKLAVMGCIVNGPGEMADADYGYVGASRGKVTLYQKGEIYKKNIDQDKALEELVNLLKENNEFK